MGQSNVNYKIVIEKHRAKKLLKLLVLESIELKKFVAIVFRISLTLDNILNNIWFKHMFINGDNSHPTNRFGRLS